MTRISWRLLVELSRLLEAEEREAALGDFAESGRSGGRALYDLLGLIAKRQAALWAAPGPWLALVFLVLPVGYALGQTSLRLSGWLHINALTLWRTGERYLSGMTAGEEILVAACQLAGLVLWTWTSGFALAALARKTVWAHAALFSLAWLVLLLSPLLRGYPPGVAPAMVALRAALLFVPVIAFLLPSVWGARKAFEIGRLGSRQAMLLAAAAAAMTVLMIWTGTWHAAALERWSEGAYPAAAIDWTSVLPRYALLNWPVAYIVAAASAQGRALTRILAK